MGNRIARVCFSQFFFLGGGENGGPKQPPETNNVRWSEIHTELCVGCFFTKWHDHFTANFYVFLLFLGGKGGMVRTPLTSLNMHPAKPAIDSSIVLFTS